MVTAEKLITADDLWAMPRTDDRRYELVRGELVEMVPASGTHGVAANEIGRILGNFVREHNLGLVFAAETGFLLARDPDIVRAPDAAFLAWARVPEEPGQAYWPVAPDLAVEVVSPGDRADVLQARVQDFLDHGTRLVWVIYPDTQTAVVYRPSGEARLLSREEALDGEDVLPGLRFPLADLIPQKPSADA